MCDSFLATRYYVQRFDLSILSEHIYVIYERNILYMYAEMRSWLENYMIVRFYDDLSKKKMFY